MLDLKRARVAIPIDASRIDQDEFDQRPAAVETDFLSMQFSVISLWFGAVVNGHYAAHEFVEPGLDKSQVPHQVAGAALAGVEL